MAEFVMKRLARDRGMERDFEIASAATSREEIGNPVYPPARRKLAEHGISCSGKTAVQITAADYDRYDYIILMDANNRRNLRRIIPDDPDGKVRMLTDFTDRPRDVADPWYTGDFERTWQDISEGCSALMEHILTEK
jgi:protein-tyrosine phosphatase